MPTAEQIRTELRGRGVKFRSNTKKADLVKLLEDHIAETTPKRDDSEIYVSDFHRDINHAYKEVVFWRQNLCQVPSGRVGKDFVREAADCLN